MLEIVILEIYLAQNFIIGYQKNVSIFSLLFTITPLLIIRGF